MFSTFKGAEKLKASDYASSFGVGLGQIENTSQTCTPNGLHVPAGKTATWLVSGGTAYFVVFDAGNTTQIGWGEMSACKGKHTPMGDHSTAKVVFDTCDHVEPTEAAVSVSQSTPASGQADIPSIKGAYTTWVNCSDTCCYVDPGYPLTEAFHSRGPAARPPGSEKKKV